MNTTENKADKPCVKRMKQSTATRLLSVLCIVALALVFGMLVWNKSSSERFDVITEQKNTLIESADQFYAASTALTRDARAFASTGNLTYRDSYMREVTETKTRENAVTRMREIGLSAEEEGFLSQISELSNALVPLEEKALNLTQGGSSNQAVALLYSADYVDSIAQIDAACLALSDAIEARMNTQLDAINSVITLSLYATFFCLALVITIQIIVIVYVNKSLLRPILALRKNMQSMAAGDLQAPLAIPVDTSEIGQLAQAVTDTKTGLEALIVDISAVLGAMADSNFTVTSNEQTRYVGAYEPILRSLQTLKHKQSLTLLQMSRAADEVSTGSDQVSAGAQNLSQGATEQASSIQELSATIMEIAQKTHDNAATAQEASALSLEAGEQVAISNRQMEDLMGAMNEITDTSNQIGKIIKTIEDIAFQTNILALNAAIEAARAGSAGKGFAVVADEVRNLAGKSSEAAKNTTELIRSSLSAIEKGRTLTDETAQSLEIVVKKSSMVNDKIQIIAQASNEQSGAISQVNTGVEQISSVVQTNSATAEESAAASEELSGQAQMLKELVSRYQLSREDADEAARPAYAPAAPVAQAPVPFEESTGKY